ncbi:hypothetical protein [Caballeronia sp. ATUFL_M2_KS44]|uniref:hypothetical protein n=1 Tax=Caballeronia sp. ATUFL_M2_KS44 TaxID=2921767 RepID=UPI002027D6C0|nr:hypothetical protein [Caballeronia sp. ATUFL_M2_KS44]
MLYILCVASALAALSLDWLQTLTIAGHPQTFTEVNPILGRHPAKWQVSLYFIACMLLTLLVAVALYVTGHTTIGICLAIALALFEAVVVIRNKVLGVGLLG